jgi:hypothetical protein
MRRRTPIDDALRRLRRDLRRVGWRDRRRALAEARDHLLQAAEDARASGHDPGEAERIAVARFGEPGSVAGGYPRRWRGAAVSLAAAASLLVLTPSLDRMARLGSAIVPASDAMGGTCIQRWNARPRPEAGYDRAWVSPTAGSAVCTVVPHRPGSALVFFGPVSAAHWQLIPQPGTRGRPTWHIDALALRWRQRDFALSVDGRIGRQLSGPLAPVATPLRVLRRSRTASLQAAPPGVRALFRSLNGIRGSLRRQLVLTRPHVLRIYAFRSADRATCQAVAPRRGALGDCAFRVAPAAMRLSVTWGATSISGLVADDVTGATARVGARTIPVAVANNAFAAFVPKGRSGVLTLRHASGRTSRIRFSTAAPPVRPPAARAGSPRPRSPRG